MNPAPADCFATPKRPRAKEYRFSVAVLIFLAVASIGVAQTGKLPFSTFSGGAIDDVNISSLNIHVDVPVYGKAGRGLPFRYALNFDNSIWFSGFVNGTKSWIPLPNFGWRGFTEAFIGYVDYTVTNTICTPSGNPTTKFTGFTYHDSEGGSHFGGNMVDTAGCFGGPHDIEHSLDGSGYTTDVTLVGSTPVVTIYAPNGMTISPPLYVDDINNWPTSTPVGNGTITDSNGNQLTASVSNSIVTFTDTLNTAVMTIDSSNPNTVKYTYTGPDGNPASIIVSYSQYTVRTNFGLSGVAEYGPAAVSLPNSIVFPDTSSYQFTYETTPGYAPAVTGRLASITLPTGGQISYTYTGGSNGIAADGSTTGLTRTLGTSQWAYVRNIPTNAPSTTTETDPLGNQTVLTFSGSHELQRQTYQGSAQSGTLLLTQLTCYNGNTSNCATATVTSAITTVDVYDQLPSGLQSRTTTTYDTLGNPTETDQYDYGMNSPGPLLRKLITTYASLGNNIMGRPASITVDDGSGNIVSQASFGYDETAVTPTSEPQHVAITGSRGNVTSLTQLVAPSASLTKRFTYYDTGSVSTYVDVNGAQITYNYGTGSCNNTFPTSVSLPLGLSTSTVWDCIGGLPTSTTDENGNPKSVSYNVAGDVSIWRPKQITDALGNIESIGYGILTNETVTGVNSSSAVDILATFDNYGRTSTAQIRKAPGGTNFDSVETDYDALGRPSRTTSWYVGAAGQTNATAASKTTSYDALNRVLLQTGAGGDYVRYTYNGTNDIFAEKGPAPTGENVKQKQFEYDALGRLTSVCEITNMPGSGSCGQNTPANGFLTRYTYDTLNNILTATQNVQSQSPQVRTFTYDFVSRRTSVTTPESGTVAYIYDSDPNGVCQNSNPGDIVRRVDNAGISTCYAYDARRRMISATSAGLGVVHIGGAEQSKVVATPGSGTITVGGAEQSVPGAPAAAGRGSVTIQGGEQSKVDTGDCRLVNHVWVCVTIYDHGSVTLTVNGIPGTCSYSRTLNTSSGVMAGCLASAITNAAGSPVTATASGSTINMQARSGGYSSNYSFSVSSSYDSADFSGPAYTGAPSSGNLSGGADAGPPTYDVGTVSVTVGPFTASASYGQNDSPSSIASRLVNDPNTGLNIASSPVTATYNNNVVSVTAKDTGTYAFSAGSSSSDGFSPPSFSASPSVSSLSPGSQVSYDSGTVSITVGTSVASLTYGQNDTAATVANNLAATINSNQAFPATASVIYPTRVELIAKQAGSYSVSASSSSTNNLFSGPSFTTQASATSGIDSSRQTRFVYDNATVSGQAMVNVKARLAEAITCIADCTGSNIITDLGFSYDPLGNLTDAYESTPHSGGYYHLTGTYWSHGRLHTMGGLAGVPTFTFNVDGEGRISTINASAGQNPVTSTSFDTGSHVTQVVLGSGDKDIYSLDPNTENMTQFQAVIGGQTLTGTIGWNANGSVRTLAINDQLNPASNQNCTYSFDDIGRLANVNCGSIWSQTFTYDPFGNISKAGSSPFQPTYSTATNQIQSVGSFTPTYNPNGALLNDGVHSYSWDSQGNPASIDSVGLVYDAMGRMVEQARGSSYTQVVYSLTGDKFALMNGQSLQKAFLELPGGGTAVYNGSGLAYYRHPDWLGSSRVASSAAGTMYSDSSYGPFGEPYSPAGAPDLSFTGKNQDTVVGLYDFPYREYSPLQGRWVECDPVGTANADPASPQTWNKYIYAANSPTTLIDPNGLDELPPCKDLIIMGITNTSTLDGGNGHLQDMQAAQQLAADNGYNIAFPYSNMGTIASVWDVFRQGQGATTGATKDVMEAMQYTIAQGGTSVIAISGGAQAYASAMASMPGASSQIEAITYLSPGMGGSQLVRGTQSTDRYHAHGIVWDGIVNWTASAEAGTVNDNHQPLDCPRHWAKCELQRFLDQCGAPCKHGPCQSKIFARDRGPRDNPNVPTPPNPGYHIGEYCVFDGETWNCIDFIYRDFGMWGGFFDDDNPGGSWCMMSGHCPFH